LTTSNRSRSKTKTRSANEQAPILSARAQVSFRPRFAAGCFAAVNEFRFPAHAGNYDIETRPGYFAPAEKPAPADDPRSRLDREVAASGTIDDFPASVAIQVGKPSASQRTLSVVVRIDVSKLGFTMQDGRKKQRIVFVSAILDAQGNVVTAKEGFMDLALKPETYERLAKSGLNAQLSFQIPPGLYGLREVVQEAVEGKLSSATHSVDLR
jgi:hypothetical protein